MATGICPLGQNVSGSPLAGPGLSQTPPPQLLVLPGCLRCFLVEFCEPGSRECSISVENGGRTVSPMFPCSRFSLLQQATEHGCQRGIPTSEQCLPVLVHKVVAVNKDGHPFALCRPRSHADWTCAWLADGVGKRSDRRRTAQAAFPRPALRQAFSHNATPVPPPRQPSTHSPEPNRGFQPSRDNPIDLTSEPFHRELGGRRGPARRPELLRCALAPPHRYAVMDDF